MGTDAEMTDDDTSSAAAKDRAATEAPTLDRRVLLQRVVAASGVPAQQARRVIDAVLAEIGNGIDAGGTLALAPLGKLRTMRKSGSGNAAVHTLRLRRTPAKPGAEGDGEADALPGAKARGRGKAAGAPTGKTAGATAKPARDKAGRSAGAAGKPAREADDDGDD